MAKHQAQDLFDLEHLGPYIPSLPWTHAGSGEENQQSNRWSPGRLAQAPAGPVAEDVTTQPA